MTRYIYTGGVPGVGKTSNLSSLPSRFCSLEYVDSGKIKYPESQKKFGINLSQLNQEQTEELNSWFFHNLFDIRSNKILIIDSHYKYPVNGGFVKLIPNKVPSFDLFLLFEARASIIRQRRINRGRHKDSIKLSFLEREIIEERTEAERLSKENSIPLEIISTEMQPNLVIKHLEQIFRNYNLI